MKKKSISTNSLLVIDTMTNEEKSMIRGGASKIKITGSISVNYPPVKGQISISN